MNLHNFIDFIILGTIIIDITLKHNNKFEMSKINITVNDKKLSVNDGTVITDLIEDLELDISKVAVERNLEIIDVDLFNSQKLTEGDKIEIVHFIGGG